jgi:Lrp/AsnC family transcriptional regulator for asnA, asnC and gidA
VAAEEQIDALDWAILEDLQDDGRRSYREIGKRLGVAPATVRSRVMQLMADGVVEIVAVPNPWKLGVGFFGTVALHIDPDQIETVAQLMAEREETSWVGITVTGCDVMVEIALADVQEFSWYRQNVLANLPGYRDADVYLLSEVRKMRYRLHSKSSEGDAVSTDYDDDAAAE